MSDSIAVNVCLALIKSFVCIYDLITFPIYYLSQKPWILLKRSQQIKAKHVNPENDSPYSSWTRCVDETVDHIVDNHFISKCQTVSQLFSKGVQVFGQKKCFGFRPVLAENDVKQTDGKIFRKQLLGDYQWFSYHEIDARVQHIACGLLWSGVRPGDNVLIFAETRIEWMLACQAVFRMGATVATLYATLGDDAIVHGINETEVTHMITNYDLLPKLSRLESRLPHVKSIVYMEGFKRPDLSVFSPKIKLMAFSLLEEKGKQNKHLKGENPKPEDVAVLMYTSGSTGIPKGVMITHENILAATKAFFTIAHALSQKDVYIGYLPLAHVLEMAAEMFFFSLGMSTGYASPLTLTDKSTGIATGCRGDASLLQPTVMTAVPLILDRIRKGIGEQVQAKGQFFTALFNFAIDYKKFWTRKGFSTPILNFLICRKIKAMLGSKVRLMAVGSAPLAPETHEFIRACLDVELLQGYGLTETSASATLMDLNDLSVGRVGAPLRGVHIKLVDWTEGQYKVQDKPNPRGEIVVGGKNITAGYYRNETLTKESYFEEDGMRWFYTGDIGEIHADGSVKIIDRKKDLVKLQMGEYVSLGKVEAELKSCPFVDNICVYGDSFHAYLIALVVPNAKALQLEAKKLLRPEGMSYSELCRDSDIISLISKSIQEFGVKSKLHKNEIPLKIKLCSEEWLPDSGLVTAALKLRRKNIQDFYQIDINRMYGIMDSKST